MTNPIKILIADDHTVVRAGLASILNRHRGLKVIGEACDGQSAIEAANRLHPDVVIMDLMMPGINGATAAERILCQHPNAKIIILSSYTNSEDISRALSVGAVGALSKTATSDELAEAIRGVVRGETIISPDIQQILDSEPAVPDMTQKQLDILHSVTRGLTNGEIALQHGVSANMVKKQLKSIFAKLGASTRSEAIAIALRKFLIKI